MLTIEGLSNVNQQPTNEILDEDGFLIDPSAWDRSFTELRAMQSGITLSDKHWLLIDLIRDKYLRLGALPPMRSVCKKIGLHRQVLKDQFGSCLNLWKMAGLPNPGEEAKTYMN